MDCHSLPRHTHTFNFNNLYTATTAHAGEAALTAMALRPIMQTSDMHACMPTRVHHTFHVDVRPMQQHQRLGDLSISAAQKPRKRNRVKHPKDPQKFCAANILQHLDSASKKMMMRCAPEGKVPDITLDRREAAQEYRNFDRSSASPRPETGRRKHKYNNILNRRKQSGGE